MSVCHTQDRSWVVKMQKDIGVICGCKVPTKAKGSFIILLYDQLCFMIVNDRF